MTRRILAAAASLCALAFALPALAATTATEATSVTVPYGSQLVGILNLVNEAVVPALAAALLGVLYRVFPLARLFLSQAIVEKLVRNALDYALNSIPGAGKDKVLSVDVGSAVIAKAAQRAIDQAPGWLLNLAGGPQGVAEKVFRALHLEPDATTTNTLAPAIASLPAKA